jgi:hypothetical protein
VYVKESSNKNPFEPLERRMRRFHLHNSRPLSTIREGR